MPIFVYVTRDCEEAARSHGILSDMERFKERVELTQSTSLFDPFPPPYLVKKKLGGRQGRLIAEHRPIGENAVIVFQTVIVRGSKAYSDFVADPAAFGAQHLDGSLSEEKLRQYVSERTATAPPPSKPEPSDGEYHLLYSAFAHQTRGDAESLICETRLWVEQVTQERVSKQLALLCKPCVDAFYGEPGLHFTRVDNKAGWGVWSLRRSDRMLLISVATDTTQQEAGELARQIAGQLEGKDDEALLQASRRAYPALILADDELWIDLEREPVANMALSPEESQVLESARGGEHPFPLFINGRAGSGKSTILQYLFADLLFHYLQFPDHEVLAPPIYLTANGDLLRVARTFVERLLKSEAAFTKEGIDVVSADNRGVLDEAFREFQPHLLSLIPPEDRRRFARASRVDYPRFRRLWLQRFGKEPKALREYGPDLSWHIIRSYIKGMSSETYLEPEDYEQLPSNQISVTHNAFKQVYERVWEGWYKDELQQQQLWDDQDLTRHILDNDLVHSVHPAVFCDEAQDFTRLEMELLLRLNLFSDRGLRPIDVDRVPFAFAGDPFQTLNPTGFRWDAIKASFVEKFVFELDPERQSGRVDLNYRELKYNYRSTYRIVRFANQVQALRAALFQLPDLRPQTPWTTERDSFPVVWFQSDDAQFWKAFRENPTFVVIIPCGEGEEAEFVQNDPILRQNIRVDDNVPVNVLSASRAKGCEYPAVIVYGFGAHAEGNLIEDLQSDRPVSEDPDRSLPLQYFVNRVYVAVSRPKRRLVIVDSVEGFSRLWRCAQDETIEATMLAHVKNGREVWGRLIEGMNIGKPEELTKEIASDPLENARAFEADGLARQDGFLLRQAAQAYRSAGESLKAAECRAHAFEAEGLWYEAGMEYFKAGFKEDGLRCLWRAGSDGWMRLVEFTRSDPTISHRLESEWATAIVNRCSAETVVKLLEKFAKSLADSSFRDAVLADPVWSEALRAILSPIIDPKQPAPSEHELLSIATLIDRVAEAGIALPPESAAEVYFLAKKYDTAITLWDKCGARPPSYHSAKASVAPYPDRILSLANLRLYEQITNAYKEAPSILLTPEQASAVSDAFREMGHLKEAFGIAVQNGLGLQLLKLVMPALNRGESEAANQALHAGLSLLIEQGLWSLPLALISSGGFVPSKEWKEVPLQQFVNARINALRNTLIRAVARSEALVNAPESTQKQMSNYLRKALRVKDGQWRPHITVEEAGAAFERGGRFVDALAFYEAVANENSFRREEKSFARTRWIISKQRQLELELSHGGAEKAKQIQYDIEQEKQALSLKSLDDIDVYPSLAKLEFAWPASTRAREVATRETGFIVPSAAKTETDKADPLVMTSGSLKFEFSRRIQRCNVTNLDTMTTAFIKVGERACGGEVDFSRFADHSWKCDTWKMVVRFPAKDDDAVTIDLQEAGVQIRLRC